MPQGSNDPLFGRMALASAALAAFLMFTGAPPVRADCQRRVVKAEHKLHREIERHGSRSKQAEHSRHELREARDRCWSRKHRWWDEHAHRWHTDRDWDDHDHDRD